MNVRFFLLMVVGMTTTVIPSEAGRPTRNLCFYPNLRIDIIPNPFTLYEKTGAKSRITMYLLYRND